MNKKTVINFLKTMCKKDEITSNISNANRDYRLHNWSESTLKAILKGIWTRKEGEEKFMEYIKKLEEME